MNKLKKYLGYLWILLGPIGLVFMCYQAWDKVSQADAAHQLNTALQWGIILLVFIPIAFGFMIFGKYVTQDEYNGEE